MAGYAFGFNPPYALRAAIVFSSARRTDATRREDFSIDQASPVGTIAAVSTIKITLLSGARVQCNTPFGTVKP